MNRREMIQASLAAGACASLPEVAGTAEAQHGTCQASLVCVRSGEVFLNDMKVIFAVRNSNGCVAVVEQSGQTIGRGIEICEDCYEDILYFWDR